MEIKLKMATVWSSESKGSLWASENCISQDAAHLTDISPSVFYFLIKNTVWKECTYKTPGISNSVTSDEFCFQSLTPDLLPAYNYIIACIY